MTVNSYFNHISNNPLQDLQQDLVDEVIQARGHDLQYVVKNNVSPDYLYAESPLQQFDTVYTLEFLLESVDGFDSSMLISDFGLELNQTANYVVSMRRFKEEVPQNRPKAGDLLYVPMTKSLLEIKEVKDDDPFYQFGKNYTYKISCQLFEYNQEDFGTGNTELDGLLNSISNITDVDTDPYSDNTDIEAEANTIKDFTENNPFGDY